MRLSHLALTAATASAADFLRADDVLHRSYASLMTSTSPIDANAHLLERDQGSSLIANMSSGDSFGANVPLNEDGTLNATAWSATTNAACISRLRSVDRSSNPSGTSVCYNLPSLNWTSGVFEAELRLYNVSQARGDFAGVAPIDIAVSLSYNGARASQASQEAVDNATTQASASPGDPQLIEKYVIAGQVDAGKMVKDISMADLQVLLMPIITLKANDASTTVSMNEASFLTGVFSQQTIQSDFAVAQAAVQKMTDSMHNGTLPFVLPGTQFMIFPIGLLITGTWLLLAVAAYGFGTYERMQYADMYKRRQQGTLKGRTNTI